MADEIKNIEASKYCQCMEKVMRRVRVIINVLDNGKTLGDEYFDYELVALNFRKILELVALGSMVGNAAAYKESYSKAEVHWHATRILEDIEKLNPDFYPKPVDVADKGVGAKHITPTTRDFLTKKDFVTLYNKCGEMMHEKNVFLFGSHSVDFILTPKEWLEKIIALLDMHTVSLLGTDEFWLVVMKGEGDRPHAFTLGPAIDEGALAALSK